MNKKEEFLKNVSNYLNSPDTIVKKHDKEK